LFIIDEPVKGGVQIKKNFKTPIILFSFFVLIAITMYYLTNNAFLIFNFLYIGFFVATGIYLFTNGYKYGRYVVQFGVGLYMFVFLGLILQENMLVSGFFFYLFLGVFQAAVIHYLVAKIIGPLLFGRGWCGYACWIVMVLDLLPYKIPKTHERVNNLGLLRYALFLAILISVTLLFYLKVPNLHYTMFLVFVVGNILYYISGIALAYKFKDNRAFCKYICPIVAFLKPTSYFSILRVKANEETCTNCKHCINICPMDVDILDPKRSRKYGTECIMCLECLKGCPNGSIKM
jgi:polyferredoxin